MRKYWVLLTILGISVTAAWAEPDPQVISGNETIHIDARIPALANVISMNGIVLYKKAATTYWEEVSANQDLYSLDVIKTVTDSMCELKLSGGHIVKLQANTNLVLQGRNKKDSLFQKLKTTVGKIWVRVIKGSTSDDQFQVETPYASISVKGTLFSVDALLKQVVTYEGKVDVLSSQGSTLLEKGFQSTVSDTGMIEPAKKITEQSLKELKEFSQQSSLPKDYLDNIYDELSHPVVDLPKASPAAIPAVAVVPLVPVVVPPLLGLPDFSGLLGQRPTVNKLVVRGEFIEPENLLYTNPAYLTLLASGDVGAVYAKKTDAVEVKKYLDKTSDAAYRFPVSGGLGELNGSNKRITDLPYVFAFNGFDTNQAIGIYYRNIKSAIFQPTTIDVNKNELVSIFYGLATQLNRFNLGATLKGTILLNSQDTRTYVSLNQDRNNGVNKTGIDELFSTLRRQDQINVYSLNTGLGYDVNEWCSLGVSLENLLVSDTRAIKGKQLDLGQKNHLSVLCHGQDAAKAYVDYAMGEESMSLTTCGIQYPVWDGVSFGINGLYGTDISETRYYLAGQLLGLHLCVASGYNPLDITLQHNF